jgi:uncharacterized protein (TIGR04255 family)
MEPEKLEFENLPLVEVALRFSLLKPLPVTLEFISDLFEELRSDFSRLGDLTTIEHPPGKPPGITLESRGRVHGARFSRSTDGITLSVQADLLIVRWNQDLNSATGRYPGFQRALLPAYETLVKSLEKLLGQGFVQVPVLNMSYVNFVLREAPITWGHVSTLLRLDIPPALVTASRIRSFDAAVQFDDVDYVLSIREVDAEDQVRPTGFILTNVAGCRVLNPNDILPRLRNVHNVLVRKFADLLTDQAAAEWKRI